MCAVNGAALIGTTRAYAEARSRVAFGLSLLSAGTPMFFMGEEVGAQKPYRYDTFMANREDIAGDRLAGGARLFRFYQDAIRFSRRHSAVRARGIDVIHVNDGGRVIAFRRSTGSDELLIVASFNNRVFEEYVIQTEHGGCRAANGASSSTATPLSMAAPTSATSAAMCPSRMDV